MRLQRYGLILLTTYLTFIIGGLGSNVLELGWFNHIFITGLLLAWLGWRIKNRRGLPPSPLNLPMLAIIALGLLSVPFSYDPRMALENMWLPVIYALFFLFIVNSFHRAQNRLIIETIFLMATVTILLSIVQIGSILFGWGITNTPELAWINFLGTGISFPVQTDLRIYLPFGVSTQVAGFIAPIVIICLAWAISVTKTSYRYVLGTMGILLSVTLVFTFSRGGLISVSVGLFAFFILRLIRSEQISTIFSRRTLAIIFGLFGLMTVVGFIVIAIGSQAGRQSGDSVRIDLWKSAIEMTIDNPITGVGTGLYGRGLREYRELVTARDRLSTAHNIYLNVTAEHGLGILLILLGTIWITGKSWWQLRQDTPQDSARWIRLNGMMAALIAFAIHNMFDTLNIVASMLLFFVMIIYCTVKPAKSRLDTRPEGNQILASISFIIILAYGIWFVVIVDPAYRKFDESLNSQNDQLVLAQEALEIDPYVNVYRLQITYLIGEDALGNPTSENLDNAIQEYNDALILEPTWDTGMINLAALYEADGNLDQAQEWLNTARGIILTNTASLHWARIAEINNYSDDEEIILAYLQGIRLIGYLPLSDFWTETALRQEALERYLSSSSPEHQYRVTRVHFPEQLETLVPENPETASEWWVVGEHALTINNNTELAITAFSNAINLTPTGSYYASRARAYAIAGEIDLANTDLQISDFLGTNDEYPNAIRASIATDPEEIKNFSRNAIPQIFYSQNFEGVLFNRRRGGFITYRQMRFTGRGTTIMQIWFDLAEQYEAEGNITSAITIYESIAFHTPENNDALAEIERLRE